MRNNVLCWLEESARNFCDKKAFEDEKTSITFGELQKRAEFLSLEIASLKSWKQNSPVAVIAPRNVQSIVAFMGALYAGCFYAPIDGEMPVLRARAMLENLKPSLILYQKNCEKFAAEFADVAPLFEYSEIANGVFTNQIREKRPQKEENERLSKIRSEILDIDPAYVIHTSGSTGVPKGIAVSHRSVMDFVDWLSEKTELSHEDVFANQAPFFFDLSVKDIYSSLKLGATDFIVPKKMFMFPQMLVEYLDKNNVTVIAWATSAFNLTATSGILDKKVPGSLKKVILGGEALWGRNLNAWRRNLPNVKYINLYGPTEVTVDCSCYMVEKEFEDSEAVPIGKPCENMQIMLLDENLKRVQKGEPGEICVRGTGLALGYYNDDEKTKQAFVQNPEITSYRDIIYRTGDIGVEDEEGNIVFRSRKDGQIKHMGYRIELGETEGALNGIEEIRAAVCFYDSQASRIVAFYEPINPNEATKEKLTLKLLKKLPKYMLPNVYVNVEKMPYTAGGKIDRVKLKNDYLESKEKQS